MARKETIVSVDIECTGPCPGLHSMISLGAVACHADVHEESGYKVVDEFSVNLQEMPGLTRDLDTMAFWAKNPEAWEASTKDPVDAEQAMRQLKKWLSNLPAQGRPVFCAYPAGFDFTFVYWYFHKFTGSCPFGFQALDMKSYSHALLGKNFRHAAKRNMPDEWFPAGMPHTHVALDDAREQAYLFFQMRRAAEALRSKQ